MAEIRRKLVIVGDGACGKTCLLMYVSPIFSFLFVDGRLLPCTVASCRISWSGPFMRAASLCETPFINIIHLLFCCISRRGAAITSSQFSVLMLTDSSVCSLRAPSPRYESQTPTFPILPKPPTIEDELWLLGATEEQMCKNMPRLFGLTWVSRRPLFHNTRLVDAGSVMPLNRRTTLACIKDKPLPPTLLTIICGLCP